MQQKMIVDISEIDPICAMQACFDGFNGFHLLMERSLKMVKSY